MPHDVELGNPGNAAERGKMAYSASQHADARTAKRASRMSARPPMVVAVYATAVPSERLPDVRSVRRQYVAQSSNK